MSLLPSELIAEAVGLAYPYVPEWATARGPLLRKLTSLDDKIVDMIMSQAPERIAKIGADITISDTGNQQGYALDFVNARSYHNFKYIDNAGAVTPITVYTALSPSQVSHPAGVVAGDVFYPIDPWGSRWTATGSRFVYIGNGDKIAFEYVPESSPITTMSQALVSPDEAGQYIIAELVLQILMASRMAPPEALQSVIADRKDQWDGLVLTISKRGDAQPSFGLPRRSDIGTGGAVSAVATQHLEYLTESGNTLGQAFLIQFALHNADHSTVTGYTGPVSIALGFSSHDGTGDLTLSGTLVVNAVAGVATWDDLVLDATGTITTADITLVASKVGSIDGESPVLTFGLPI